MSLNDSDIVRIFDEIAELRDCKREIATLKEYRVTSDDKFKEIRENIEKIFDKIEGGRTIGINREISEIKSLLSKFEENVNEVYDRIEKIEALLEKTIREVYELTPIVKALMNVENERRVEKASFRREFRMWVIGFIGTVIITAAANWVAIKDTVSKQPKQEDIRALVIQSMNQTYVRDSLKRELKRLDSTANSK